MWPCFPPDNTLSSPSTLLVHSRGQPHVWIQQVTVQIEKQQVGESWRCYSPRCTHQESRWNLKRILKKDHFQRVQPYPMTYSVIVIFVNVTSLEIFSQPQTLISDIMLPWEKNTAEGNYQCGPTEMWLGRKWCSWNSIYLISKLGPAHLIWWITWGCWNVSASACSLSKRKQVGIKKNKITNT